MHAEPPRQRDQGGDRGQYTLASSREKLLSRSRVEKNMTMLAGLNRSTGIPCVRNLARVTADSLRVTGTARGMLFWNPTVCSEAQKQKRASSQTMGHPCYGMGQKRRKARGTRRHPMFLVRDRKSGKPGAPGSDLDQLYRTQYKTASAISHGGSYPILSRNEKLEWVIGFKKENWERYEQESWRFGYLMLAPFFVEVFHLLWITDLSHLGAMFEVGKKFLNE
jgi:hypothetical protein